MQTTVALAANSTFKTAVIGEKMYSHREIPSEGEALNINCPSINPHKKSSGPVGRRRRKEPDLPVML